MAKKKNYKFVYWQTVLMSAVLLAVLLLVGVFGGNRIAETGIQFGNSIRTALLLFILWLVISTGIRSVKSLIKKSGFLDLLLAGSIIGVVGSSGCYSLAKVVGFFREGSTLDKVFDAQNLIFFAGLSLVISLLTTINLQTKNRMLGNILEVLVIIILIFFIQYFKK